jgi:hypothetical protein
MQNREELRQKRHDRRKKTTCHKRGKGGGGIKIIFRIKIQTPNNDINVICRAGSMRGTNMECYTSLYRTEMGRVKLG